MVKLKKKSLSRGSFRTHGRVIGNKNFFIFGLRVVKLHFNLSFGLSGLRTNEPSDYRTFGLVGLQTIGPSDYESVTGKEGIVSKNVSVNWGPSEVTTLFLIWWLVGWD